MNDRNNQNNINNVGEDLGADTSEAGDAGTDMPAGNCQIDGCAEGLVCNTSSGICQECEFSEECGNNATCGGDGRCICDVGHHFCGDTCVDNTAVETCGDRCDACPAPTGGTAACENEICTGECSGQAVLDPGTNACVGCVENADCSDPLNSVCDNSFCTGCAENSDCSHLTDTPVCDAAVNRCVECTSDAECGGNSCNLATGLCTQTPVASVGNCEPCVSNTECVNGFECVPMFYDGQVRNSAYCLRVKDGGCPDPGFTTDITRADISSTTEKTYCGVRESLATCEAVLDYGSTCATASDCGAPGLNDGYCEPIEFEFGVHCSYRCDDSNQCTDGLTGFVVCMQGPGVAICGGF